MTRNLTALTIRQWRYDGERPPVALLVWTSVDSDRRYWHSEGRFVTIDPEDHKPRNLDSDQPLDDLGFRVQGEVSPPEHFGPSIYGYDLRLSGYGIWRTPEVQAKAKAMALIEKRMGAIRTARGLRREDIDSDGFREWFGDFVLATGIEAIFRYADGYEPRGLYDQSEYETLTVEQAADYIETSYEAARAVAS